MSLAAERIHAILMELDDGTGSSEKNAEEIADILLQRQGKNDQVDLQEEVHIASTPLYDTAELEANLYEVNNQWRVDYYHEIANYGRGTERIIVFAKRLIRKLIRSVIEPITRQLQEFHAVVTRTLNALRNNDIVFDNHIRELEAKSRELEAKGRELEAKGSQRDREIQSLTNSLQSAGQSFSDQLEKQQLEIDALHKKINELQNSTNGQAYLSIDYFDFENHFRGNRTQIKEQQKTYLHHYIDCKNVLDLGSGRGEFLELLTEKQIPVTGVELYEPFVDYCRTRGYKVVCEDAVQYLLNQGDASCDGIFASQLVEHLTTQDLLMLCRESYRVLEDGKTLIIETPNPTCVSTYLNSFYMDPTHVKPIHPKTLEYFLKKAGFRKIDIVYTKQSQVDYRLPLLAAPADNLAEFNDGVNFMSDIIFGSQDYAIIAVK